jgi:hypothetical protein
MLALVIGLPAAAVIAGIATLILAARGAGDPGDHRVSRVAQSQTTDLGPDRAAARLALRASVVLEENGGITLRFDGASPGASSLELALRHGTDPQRDRTALLRRVGDREYAGHLDELRAAGDYNAELAPPGAEWRLVGRIEAGGKRLALEPAVGG